jgi:hypothetical protein
MTAAGSPVPTRDFAIGEAEAEAGMAEMSEKIP